MFVNIALHEAIFGRWHFIVQKCINQSNLHYNSFRTYCPDKIFWIKGNNSVSIAPVKLWPFSSHDTSSFKDVPPNKICGCSFTWFRRNGPVMDFVSRAITLETVLYVTQCKIVSWILKCIRQSNLVMLPMAVFKHMTKFFKLHIIIRRCINSPKLVNDLPLI